MVFRILNLIKVGLVDFTRALLILNAGNYAPPYSRHFSSRKIAKCTFLIDMSVRTEFVDNLVFIFVEFSRAKNEHMALRLLPNEK